MENTLGWGLNKNSVNFTSIVTISVLSCQMLGQENLGLVESWQRYVLASRKDAEPQETDTSTWLNKYVFKEKPSFPALIH